MFDIGFGEFLLLVVAALFVFGPDRLPGLAAQSARALRQVRGLAAGVRQELTDVVGPELGGLDFGDLNPRRAVARTLLDADQDAAAPPSGPRTAPAEGSRTPSPGAEPAEQAAPAPVFDPDAT